MKNIEADTGMRNAINKRTDQSDDGVDLNIKPTGINECRYLIFVISVIISIITTMRENSHKDRQIKSHLKKHLPIMNQKKGGFFEEIERTFKEISEELNEEEKKSSKRKDDDTLPPLLMNFQKKSLNRNLL